MFLPKSEIVIGQPASKSTAVLPTWVNSSAFARDVTRIERESLRMQSDGFLSQADHPQALGSALTHPHITTDYSEALLEFITPPQPSITEALHYLKDIHSVAHRHLEHGEKLWPLSMPCMLDDNDDKIRLAQYGSSNIGKFKDLVPSWFRGTLWSAVCKPFQVYTITCLFPDQLFEQLQQHETDEALKALSAQDYRSHRYFGLIRNFIRLTPLVMFLVGASPSVCQCFMTGREHHLLPLLRGTLYLPYATALRMGRFGYQNSAQKQLGIHYNNMMVISKAYKRQSKPLMRRLVA